MTEDHWKVSQASEAKQGVSGFYCFGVAGEKVKTV